MTDEMVLSDVKKCPWCGQDNAVLVPKAGYERWLAGEYIQLALPGLSADDREALMTGTHAACWNAMFPEED